MPAGRTTRQSVADFLKQIEDGKDMCIVPSEIITDLVNDNRNMTEKFIETTEMFNKTNDKVVAVMERIAIALESKDQLLGNKLDNLTNTMTNTNRILEAQLTKPKNVVVNEELKANEEPKVDTKKQMSKVKEIHKKYLRSEHLTNVYEDLMNATPPFVPSKFRTKVNKNTPEFEIPVHEKQALNTCQHNVDFKECIWHGGTIF